MTQSTASLLAGLLVVGFACKTDKLLMGESTLDGGNENPDANTSGQASSHASGGSTGSLDGATSWAIEGLSVTPDGAAADGATADPSIGIDASSAILTPPTSTCGNGLIDQGETCDDGNTLAGDGCSNICLVEVGFTCTTTIVLATTTVICQPICGDGIKAGIEECDLGSDNGLTGQCSSACKNLL